MKFLSALAALLIVSACTRTALAQGYTYTTLDYPGAADTAPQAIDHHMVAGWYDDGVTTGHGFTYNTSDHTFTSFDDPSATQGTYATGINGTTVIGQASNALGYVGFTYDTNTQVFTDFTVFGSTATAAYGINSGNIVGFYNDGTQEHGFVMVGGVGGTTTAYSHPSAANTEFFGMAGSLVVGQYQDNVDPNLYSGFIFNLSNSSYQILHDPGAQANYATVPMAISGNLVAGYYNDPVKTYVGFVYDMGTGLYHDVDVPESNLGVQPYGLSGTQMSGTYFDGTTGRYRGFLATVPEASVYALVAGVVGLAGVRKKRRG